MSPQPASNFPNVGNPSRLRLPILDGLRGGAALIVVAYHIFDSDPVNRVNHGYLAVDFFFMLSGYVMGYAYDDRWETMSIGSFFKRRLVRLHPMVVIGSIIGANCFYFSASSLFPLVNKTSFAVLMLSTLMGAFLIPSTASRDVRGWGESYPLNGPMWSLFFEYLANIAYAFWIRKFSLRVLGVLAVVFAGLLGWVIVTSETGSVGCGWLFTEDHLWKGSLRMLFPFVAGLFIFRLGKTIRLKHAMVLTTLALLITLPMPRVGEVAWVNGVYECLILMILLPVIVLIGAGSQPVTRFGERACNFLGELSYPLYLVHYPIHYIFFGWLSDTHPAWSLRTPVSIGVYVSCLVLGYAVMRFVDTPIRKRLARFVS